MANTTPIFAAAPNIGFADAMTVANTTKSGTSGTKYYGFTAGANGSLVERVKFKHLGTNVATVVRCFINNGSDDTVATNNSFWDELTLPATTNTETASVASPELYLGINLPAGYKLFFTLGTGVASGWDATTLGADF